jgi:acetylcholinesterase
MWPNREPTPAGVTMREGIPHWPAYTNEKKEFMAINKYWAVKHDYSLVITQHRDHAIVQVLIILSFLWQYYTITVDKAGPRAVSPETAKECASTYWKSKRERRNKMKN